MIGIGSLLTAQIEVPAGIFARVIDQETQVSEAFEDYAKALVQVTDVVSFQSAFPQAKTEELTRTYFLKLKPNADYTYFSDLLKSNPDFEEVLIEYVALKTCTPSAQGCTNPPIVVEESECSNATNYNDPGSQCTDHIERMELPCAWTETDGSSDVVVGVVDVFFDQSHPDLAFKFKSISGNCIEAAATSSHGYASAGGITAIRNNGLCVAGAGGETKLRGYCVGGGDLCVGGAPPNSLIMLAWEAYLDGVEVINISYSGNDLFRPIIQEIVDGGTTVVVAAKGDSHSQIADIRGVINVGQLTEQGEYQRYESDEADLNIDIAVPILNSYRLTSPLVDDCGRGTAQSSMAAAYVSGTVALLLAEAPCLSPAAIEKILKATSNSIPGADDPASPFYEEIKNVGALNAYQAVLAAKKYSAETLKVQSGETVIIENDVRFFKKVEIEPLGRLIFRNSMISMSETNPAQHKEGFFTVKRGAKLIFEETKVTSACRDGAWGGIRVWGNNEREQPEAMTATGLMNYNVLVDADDAGIVYFAKGSSFSRAKRLVATRSDGVPYSVQIERRGGLVVANDAFFIDNQRVAEFLQYPNPISGLPFKNKSRFLNCLFQETTDDFDRAVGVTIWDTDGVTFNKCTFREIDVEAIVSFDAEVFITDGNSFSKSIDLSRSGKHRAISSTSTYPSGGSLVLGDDIGAENEFYFEGRGGTMVNSYSQGRFEAIKITNNSFRRGAKGGTAIDIEGASAYNIEGNTFFNGGNFMRLRNTSDGSRVVESQVQCNYFQEGSTGVSITGENGNTEIVGNDFYVITSDIRLAANSSIKGVQGGPGQPADNCFYQEDDKDIVEGVGINDFIYFVEDGGVPDCSDPLNAVGYTIVETTLVSTACSSNRPPLPGFQDRFGVKSDMYSAEVESSNDPNNVILFEAKISSKELYASMYQKLIWDRLKSGNNSEALMLANEFEEKVFPFTLFGTLVETGDYQQAELLLNSSTSTTDGFSDFKFIQSINLARLKDTIGYELSGGDYEILDKLADDDGEYSGYAKALMLYLENVRYEIEEIGVMPPKTINSSPNKLPSSIVYPNPANDFLIIPVQVNENTTEPYTIEIQTMDGRLQISKRITPESFMSIDVSELKPGVYVVSIKSLSKTIESSKVVIAR
ncbi:S8 family serine peptidase [Neolewinella agarilytica]|uniref:Por secretion system C-terminal sorting domain-containing protein n=1 Tax=Neolewinella agarilytica TaxID=478744 RepID=A0A1H9BIX0_9BACT|nr:S8 family serine peptidase [Neolewinella agarilytica]SEP88855.1 Por secretion system C-terminal sorting domain-containing protein [Neolewinella agarilytica]